MSADKLIEKIIEKQNPSVLGLDPMLSYIPQFILASSGMKSADNFVCAADAIFEFNKGLIDALYDVVPAVKPQLAYYELYGWQGMKAYKQTITYARQMGLYVIADGKRGDIGSTAQAYAAAHLGKTELRGGEVAAFDADALTVNPYLGSDGIKPFIDCCGDEKMIFALAKTSNPSSGEFQDKIIEGRPLYFHVAQKMAELGAGTEGEFEYGSVGIVAGATYPEQLKELRESFPALMFLVPGYGAQGAGAKDIAPAFDGLGLGAIVNSSRAIICAWKKDGGDGQDYAKAARAEALRMKEDLLKNAIRDGKIG